MASVSKNSKLKLFNILTEISEIKKQQDRFFPDLEVVRQQLLEEINQEINLNP